MRKEMAYALRRTVPVACGYIFLGMAFGVLLNEAGYGPVWALCSSLFIYAGSMQFIMVSLLAAGAPLYTVAVSYTHLHREDGRRPHRQVLQGGLPPRAGVRQGRGHQRGQDLSLIHI